MTKIIHRITELIDFEKIRVSEFERRCGISNGYIRKMKVRNADIGESILLKILDNCPTISLRWLILGKGQMLGNNNLLENETVIKSADTQKLDTKNTEIIELQREVINSLREKISNLESENRRFLKKHSIYTVKNQDR